MSNQVIAEIVIPVVIAVALAIWIVLVVRANRHPRYARHSQRPRRQVAGGAFRARGGRQLMPTPGAEPDETSPSGYESPQDSAPRQ